MLDSGNWIATTTNGRLDYYNAKPPLNIWLVALSFKAFGRNLVALRLVSAASAWLTVLILMIWARRSFGALISLAAGVVLSTNFGFIYVHAGRSANTDAPLTLLTLLVVVALSTARVEPSRFLWLGPLLAAVFLLKGMAVLMVLSIVVLVWLARRCFQVGPTQVVVASVLFLGPIGAWAALRSRVDGWTFLTRVFRDDLLGHTLQALEGHGHGPLFYLDVLQKQEYGWMIAASAALLFSPVPWSRCRYLLTRIRDASDPALIVGIWAVVTFLIPSLMSTKLPWYLNPFYPAFALATAWALSRGWSASKHPGRRVLVGALAALALVTAEGRLVWYSFEYRDLHRSAQGLFLAERDRLEHRTVYAPQWNRAGRFVVHDLAGADIGSAVDPEEFVRCSAAGDYFLWSAELSHPALTLIRTNGHEWLYRRDAVRAQK
jgi:4-amino-4-deoxy-L-arabinose transferase-like glycosyltransferase